MKTVGFVGWRGMVGSVVIERLLLENDFKNFNSIFFSSSKNITSTPDYLFNQKVENSMDVSQLKKCDILLTTQGSDYSKQIYKILKNENWNGYFIDASSAFRTSSQSTLILDPVNDIHLKQALHQNKKLFVGSNCTVSLLLLALDGLIKKDLVDWVSSMTYQAISGAGAAAMSQLLSQMQILSSNLNLSHNILDLDRQVQEKSKTLKVDKTGGVLVSSLLPWIDLKMENGQTKEEWKACVEANKLLNRNGSDKIMIDGTCVRVSSMRSHSQGLTIKLKRDLPIQEIEDILSSSHEWIQFVNNNKEESVKELTPLNISGTTNIAVGRVRKMNIGPEYLNVFTVGDQLLWGAAEPLVRFLRRYLL